MEKSIRDFVLVHGRTVATRSQPFYRWIEQRRTAEVWPYGRVLCGRPLPHSSFLADTGRGIPASLNFASQDYLGLSQDPRVAEAARHAIDQFGVHSAGSPALAGKTTALLALERLLAERLRCEAAVIFPTGWAAGFGTLAGLVRNNDTVLIDALAHNCLQEGARHSTAKVRRFKHNDLDFLSKLLADVRARDAFNGVFIVIESLYSMDSDSPQLLDFVQLARHFEAILIVDIAHDFGAMGHAGLGLLESVLPADGPDLVIGSFSKTFAATGGFVGCSQAAKDYLGFHSPSLVFSNAISPLQTHIALKCCEIVWSDEGATLRASLDNNCRELRQAIQACDMRVGGTPSPIVPVFVGDETIARLTSRQLEHLGVMANLVEFPAVAKGQARFRLQVMATHQPSDISRAASLMREARRAAIEEAHNAGYRVENVTS